MIRNITTSPFPSEYHPDAINATNSATEAINAMSMATDRALNGVPGGASGVDCSVSNCSYNKDGRSCSAGRIQVGPTSAVRGDDTVCSTFRPKAM
jgi:hypothetical protein